MRRRKIDQPLPDRHGLLRLVQQRVRQFQRLAHYLGNQLFNFRDTTATGPAGLGKVGHLFSGMQPVLLNHLAQKAIGQAKTFADNLAILLLVMIVVFFVGAYISFLHYDVR